MKRETVDLSTEAERLREEAEEIRETQQEFVERLAEEYGDFSNVPSEKEQAFDKFEERIVEKEGQANSFERVAEEWGDGVFVICELTTGQMGQIQDSVSEKSFEWDLETGEAEGTPKSGYAMVETLREAIETQPDGAPTRTNELGIEAPAPGDYPQQVGTFLFEKVNNLNTVGDTDLGNSSLEERMESLES